MADPALRSYTGTFYFGSATVTINKPTGTAAGDVLIFAGVNNDGSRTLSLPSGWASLAETKTTTAPGTGFWCAWKLAGGSEPASYDFVFDFSFNGPACVLAYQDSDGEIHDSDYQAISSIQTGPYDGVAPSIDTTVKSILISIAGVRYTTTGTDPTPTVPSGYTSRVDLDESWDNRALVVADKMQSASGSSGTATTSWSISGAGDGRTAAIHIALATQVSLPTLSLPGVQSITANSATPKVTLTW